MIRRPPRSTLSSSSAASDVYKRQIVFIAEELVVKLPIGILFSCTVGRICSRGCLRVDAIERKITVNNTYLGGIFIQQSLENLGFPLLTIRTLVVTEFDNGDRGICRTDAGVTSLFDRITGDLLDGFGHGLSVTCGRIGGNRGAASPDQESADQPQYEYACLLYTSPS